MAQPSDADETRLEEIVAYLDGELSSEESARVERRLSSDEHYRQQLQGIERAWKALDELSMQVVDRDFARTTMQLTVEVARAELAEQTTALPIQRRRSWLATTLVAAAAAALGFLVVRLVWQNPDRLLLASLPVVDNVDVYSQIDSTEYLRRLRTEFGPDLAELGGKHNETPPGLDRLRTVTPVDQRDAWLRGLDAAERTDLRAKANRYRELPGGEQERLRELHEAIAGAPDASDLQRTLFVYYSWLRGLPPAKQFELRSMPADERVQAVRQWADELRDDALFAMTDEELRQFVREMRQPLTELVRTATSEMAKSSERRRPGGFADPLASSLQRALLWQFASGVARPGKFQSALVEALPERTREAFQQLPPQEKVQRVMTWKRQAEALQGQISEQELERFFAEELDPQMRAELLSLPASDMQQALRRLYRRQPGLGFEGVGGWGRPPWRENFDGRDGPGGPGGRERGGRPSRPGGPRGDGPMGDRPPGPEGFGPPGEGPGRGRGFGPPRDGRPFDGPPPPPRDFGDRPRREGDERPPRGEDDRPSREREDRSPPA